MYDNVTKSPDSETHPTVTGSPNIVKACTMCDRLYPFAQQECPHCGAQFYVIVNLDPSQA